MSFNLNEEVIDGHMVQSKTKELWAIEMDIAQKLLEVCKKHNLKIWASGGTLLGAVRHRGFIPWDDDMDFVMMRDDYEKLIEIGPTEFEYPYFFQSFYTDKHFWGGMAKVRRSDTTLIEKDYKYHKDFNRGIFVDVFVLDAVPDDDNKLEKMYKKVKFLRKLLFHYRLLDARKFNFKVRLRQLFINLFFAVVNQKKVQNEMPFSKIIGGSKHSYEGTIMVPFHDMTIPIPNGYDDLLRRQYGDYMTPIKGGALHEVSIFDCKRPYNEVMLELKRKDI